MIESQSHGFLFEQWVRNTFFESYSGAYTQEWDIPAEFNCSDAIPSEFRGLPVSVKTARYGSPVGLGDALRQRRIDVPFVMVVGFWEARENDEKWFLEIGVVKFTSNCWAVLWGDLELAHLEKFDAQIKNRELHYSDARELARNWNKQTGRVLTNGIVINPKIDSKTQRRIQCSIPFNVFWECVGTSPERESRTALFGQSFPNPLRNAPPRTFTRN